MAVATLAVSMDVDNEEEMGVEAISGTGGAAEVLYSILEAKDVEKENEQGGQHTPPSRGATPGGGDETAERQGLGGAYAIGRFRAGEGQSRSG